jgi:hypothetical protein
VIDTGISDERFLEVFNLLERRIEDRYGVPVVISDVPHPFTGDLDGAAIQLDYELSPEEAVFCVAHLFGHTVQWNVCPEARDLGLAQTQRHSDPEMIARLRAYELEACGYSVQLFHDAGVTDLDQWLSDFATCDLAYLEHFYRTGEKPPYRTFWKDGQPLVPPRPIPAFTPQTWRSRWEGVVI